MRLIMSMNDQKAAYMRLMEIERSTKSQAIQTKQTAGLQPVVGFDLIGLFVLFGWALASLFEESEWTKYWADD